MVTVVEDDASSVTTVKPLERVDTDGLLAVAGEGYVAGSLVE
jgi:hypothetical protein